MYRMFLKSVFSIFAFCVNTNLVSASELGSQPIKHYIMIDLSEGTDTLVLDRWYVEKHAPETLTRTQGVQTRYQSYRTYQLNHDEQARFHAVHGRMSEIGFENMKSFLAGSTPKARARVKMTPAPHELAANMKNTVMTIPDQASYIIAEKPMPTKQTPYFRWVIFMSYPSGVDLKRGDEWMNDLVTQSPSTRLAYIYNPVRKQRRKPDAKGEAFTRVVEVWFEDRAGWKKAIADGEFAGKAPWGDTLLDMNIRSAFISERADLDFLTNDRVTP